MQQSLKQQWCSAGTQIGGQRDGLSREVSTQRDGTQSVDKGKERLEGNRKREGKRRESLERKRGDSS
eukprot:12396635-Prorocentrum_lima.AAC.1